LRPLPSSEDADDWNGAAWIGISQASISIFL
jgi:hypothetical protein